MVVRGRMRIVLVTGVLATTLGCAHAPHTAQGVPIDKRPTPTPIPAPVASTTPAAGGATTPVTVTPEKAPAASGVMSDEERMATVSRIVSDTTRSYLIQARAALQRDDLWQAESLARRARQLALSLECY